MMKFLRITFDALPILGYVGSGLLLLHVERGFLQQNFVQLFNPFLQLQVLGVLLTLPTFWIFLMMPVVGYYVTPSIESYLGRRAKRIERNTNKVASSKVASRPSQALQKHQPNFPTPTLQHDSARHPHTAVPSFLQEGGELQAESIEAKIKLLEWAIQSSQEVQFHYKNRNGKKNDRTITPITLTTDEKTVYLEGYCHSGRAKRTFALKRMHDVQLISANGR